MSCGNPHEIAAPAAKRLKPIHPISLKHFIANDVTQIDYSDINEIINRNQLPQLEAEEADCRQAAAKASD
jgi:hypothetical protein